MAKINKNLDIVKLNGRNILRRFENGESLSKLASEYSVCRKSLTDILSKNFGYTSSTKIHIHKDITDSMLDYAKNEYLTNEMTITDIAKFLNVNRKSLSKKLKQIFNIEIRRDGKKAINSDYFQNIDTYDKAYWLGFLYADGYNSGTSLEFCLKEDDLESVQHFRAALSSHHKISKKITRLNDKDFCSYRISIRDLKLCNDLVRHGCTRRKSFIITMPNLPDNLMNHFIRGYFDGDGCFHIDSRSKRLKASFTSGSLQMLSQLISYLTTKLPNFRASIFNNEKRPNIYTLDIARCSVSLFCEYIYQDSTYETRLARKYNLFIKNCRSEPKVA